MGLTRERRWVRENRLPRWRWAPTAGRLLLVLALALAGIAQRTGSAFADAPGETREGYLLVQQALGYLAGEPGAVGTEMAAEKLGDALATDQQQGVDVNAVKQGKAALEAGRVDEARTLLQASITQALRALPPATGMETGTTSVLPEQPGREGLSGQDWGFLTVSAVALLAGLVLARLFRPQDSVGELRRRLGPRSTGPGASRPT